MYSSIIKKTCKCGCGRWPVPGYEGFYPDCRPDLKEKKIKKQAERQKARNSVSRTQSSLRKLMREDEGVREGSKKVERKSDLLKEADRLFADYIKARDTGKDGRIYCPCCKEYFRATDSEVNCMHFVDRDVYLLRFDEDAAHAGHSNCNRNQHYNPSGKEYQNFKTFLIEKFGENAVAEMELAKRKINKITEEQLRTVIEHYSNQPLTNLNTEI